MKKIILVFMFFVFMKSYSQDIGIKWIKVDGGYLTMRINNSPKKIRVNDFCISATEITCEQYKKFCETANKKIPDDEGWTGGKHPVINVSWNDAIQFCKWLSNQTGSLIRLPNEAEWEFAALGGNKSKNYKYSGSNDYNEVSWVSINSNNMTQPVGTKKSNELGIYDMSGNVYEWCYTGDEIPAADNKIELDENIKHTLKGNSFDNPPDDFRLPGILLVGNSRHYNIGFRVVRVNNK